MIVAFELVPGEVISAAFIQESKKGDAVKCVAEFALPEDDEGSGTGTGGGGGGGGGTATD